MLYFAHSSNDGGYWHELKDHTSDVSDLAVRFASALGMEPEVRIASALHDLGKYGDLFIQRLRNPNVVKGIDHWSAGAWLAFDRYRSKSVAVVVQGHHIGLQVASRPNLLNLESSKYICDRANRRRLSEPDFQVLLERLESDGRSLPQIQLDEPKLGDAQTMLRTRMLLSALADADYLDTEAHFNGTVGEPKRPRAAGPTLDVDRAIAALDQYYDDLKSDAKPWVQELRKEVSSACAAEASEPVGIFTLTAPTGSGKTLAMLRFALLHAKKHGLRRIIFVLPFLTLIEQTARIYREVLKGFPPNFVLEDHSLAMGRADSDDESNEDGITDQSKLLSENWDAPIVITTNVKFFESLHHNRPSVCRKLHRLAQSVILCDEVQSLPLDLDEKREKINLITPTLATLTSLIHDFHSTIVFATATQPAFSKLQETVSTLSFHPWNPTEILPNPAEVFARSQRVTVDWRFIPQSWEELADEISSRPGTLVVVNLRKDAQRLTKLLRDRIGDAPVRHLSTNMCVAHRDLLLQEVKDLQIESKGFLVSTQCVEAGVDLDFLQVYRAWAPLDSIAQAAGRCNRNGAKERGLVVVFLPEDARYPPGGYSQSANTAKNIVERIKNPQPTLHDLSLFERYFGKLYQTRDFESKDELSESIVGKNYAEVAKLYRLIDNDGVNLVVRVGDALGEEHQAENEQLLNKLEQDGLNAELMRRIRPYTVSAFLNSRATSWIQCLDRRQKPVSGWFVLDAESAYDPLLGLTNEFNLSY